MIEMSIFLSVAAEICNLPSVYAWLAFSHCLSGHCLLGTSTHVPNAGYHFLRAHLVIACNAPASIKVGVTGD